MSDEWLVHLIAYGGLALVILAALALGVIPLFMGG
jgi:hypothetical protein